MIFLQMLMAPLGFRFHLFWTSALQSFQVFAVSALTIFLTSGQFKNQLIPSISKQGISPSCWIHWLQTFLISEPVLKNPAQMELNTCWHSKLSKRHFYLYKLQTQSEMKQWLLRQSIVNLLNYLLVKHQSPQVQGLFRSRPPSLTFSQAGVQGSRFSQIMSQAMRGAIMPAYCQPDRYMVWSLSQGNFQQNFYMARQQSWATVSSLYGLSSPFANPTSPGPSINSTLASLFQLKGLTLKFLVPLTKINGPLEQKALYSPEHPGPADILIISGSLRGLPSEGKQLQQQAWVEVMLRYPAQQGCVRKPIGNQKVSTQSPQSAVWIWGRRTAMRRMRVTFIGKSELYIQIDICFLIIDGQWVIINFDNFG